MNWRKNTDPDPYAAELRALMQLRMLPGLTDVRLKTLLQQYDPLSIIRHAATLIAPDAPARLRELEPRTAGAFAIAQKLGVFAITIRDPDYPATLLPLGDLTPPVLFARGRRELLATRTIAIIGARHSTEYGDQVADMFATDLARRGITVASGLALGIDCIAHRAALDAAGNTIAILGCGIDVPYPPRNARLQERIATDGLLLSEFAPGAPAFKHSFPMRNRIIALLSRAVLVIEAGLKSGTRITVDWALRYNGDVFAVPGPIGRPQSEGTNEIIRDGGHIAMSVNDILEPLGWVAPAAVCDDVPPEIDDPQQRAVISKLDGTAQHVDSIARSLGLSTTQTLVLLTELEISGHVRQQPGKRFSRTLRRGPG